MDYSLCTVPLGFKLTFQSCIVKNSHTVSFILVSPKWMPIMFEPEGQKVLIFTCILEHQFSNLNQGI